MIDSRSNKAVVAYAALREAISDVQELHLDSPVTSMKNWSQAISMLSAVRRLIRKGVELEGGNLDEELIVIDGQAYRPSSRKANNAV